MAGKTMSRDSTPGGGQVALLVWKALCNLNARAVPWNSRRGKPKHLSCWEEGLVIFLGTTK